MKKQTGIKSKKQKVKRNKNMISLEKGQKISLQKNDGNSLSRVAMGLGWDGVKKGGFLGFGGGAADIDLDASALIYAGDKLIDQVWFRQLASRDGNVIHSGDNRTGQGDGDDETINVDLGAISGNVSTIVFTVNSFTGQTFNDVANAYVRLVDLDSGKEVAKYSLSESGSHTGMIMATVKRSGAVWEMQAIGEKANGRTFHDMEAQIRKYL
jgi:tellurium resistance protein TerZ